MPAEVKRNPIIPDIATYVDGRTNKLVSLNAVRSSDLDLKEICVFLATGFFLDDATYFREIKALSPATDYAVDTEGKITERKKYWEWNYSPRDISLKQAVEEYATLFERIVADQTKDKQIILALSGGLDSRSLAAAIPEGVPVQTYSYEFADSFPETKYGKMIADARGFPFHKYIIPRGYLWDKIDEAARINHCNSEFTHPRQIAVVDDVKKYGDTFLLGHWGDVFFDDMGVAGLNTFEQQVNAVVKKVIKKGGLELGDAAWKAWGLAGNFKDYLFSRISELLSQIKIDDPDARIRAFKSMHWVYRWTSTNLVYFSSRRPMVLPFYHDEMAKFVSTVPEKYLAGRKIQIEYLKEKNRAIASIPWQQFDPLNLYNYEKFDSLQMVPVRAVKKAVRLLKKAVNRREVTTRNWEIQFNGKDNVRKLEQHLFENAAFSALLPQQVVKDFYKKFREEDAVYYSHSVSMLLTLSMFCKLQQEKH